MFLQWLCSFHQIPCMFLSQMFAIETIWNSEAQICFVCSQATLVLSILDNLPTECEMDGLLVLQDLINRTVCKMTNGRYAHSQEHMFFSNCNDAYDAVERILNIQQVMCLPVIPQTIWELIFLKNFHACLFPNRWDAAYKILFQSQKMIYQRSGRFQWISVYLFNFIAAFQQKFVFACLLMYDFVI